MHKDPIHRKFHQDELTFSLIYAFTETSACRCRTTKSFTAKARSWTRCRATCGKSSPTCGCCTATCGPIPARSCCSWGRIRPMARMEPRRVAAVAPAAMAVAPRSAGGTWPTSTRCTSASRRLHEVDFEHTGFEWIDCHNWQDSVLVFVRKAKDPKDYLIVCCNFTPVPRPAYKIGVPEACWYEEVSNSDSTFYGGSDLATRAAFKRCRWKATGGRRRWNRVAATGGGDFQAAAVGGAGILELWRYTLVPKVSGARGFWGFGNRRFAATGVKHCWLAVCIPALSRDTRFLFQNSNIRPQGAGAICGQSPNSTPRARSNLGAAAPKYC